MVEEINVLRKRNESLGGVFEVRAFGLVPGLGSHVSWEERLDGRIGLAMLSIQAIKGCGIGDGFDLAGRPGSAAHDEIFYDDERGYFRETNRSGGVEGGMSTGEPLVVRCAMKPLPTLTKPLRSVDIATREPAQALRERTDSCTVPAAGVVGEAMLAIVLAERLPREVRRRPRRRRPRGARRLRGADRVEAAPALATGRLVFIGFMGAGKSLAARSAAAALNVDRGRLRQRARAAPRQLDRVVLRRATASARSASRRRRRSSASCSPDPPAPGASRSAAARSPPSACATRSPRHTVVLLDVDADTAWQRCRYGRPLARDRERFEALHAERAPLYAGLADAILPADRRDEVRRALPAIDALADAPAGHEAAVGGRVPGVRRRRAARLGAVAAARAALPRHRRGGRRRSTPTASAPVEATCRIPSRGSATRRSTTADRVLRSLARAGMDHDDHVVALGGGVVGDVAGFCAAIYQRGVPVVHVPTTLVAQVDSAYGGKTGVDLPEGKNYAGAYHQPAAVLVDPGALATLPPEELAAGWAEVIKTGADRGRGAVAPRARARDARARPRPRARLRARQAADRGARRARRRRAPDPQPRPHGRPRDRDRDRATSATATARRSGSGCWPR